MNDPNDNIDFEADGVVPQDFSSEEVPTITIWHKGIAILLVTILVLSVVIPAYLYLIEKPYWRWESVFF
jgi:hypothetical protein